MSRCQHTITKVQTNFGNHFIIIEYEGEKAVGAWIEHPRKAPDAMVTRAMDDLSHALHEALSRGLK
jgi:hypothetical protein